ncbi:MAG TPA: hypothetical protein VJK52_05295 [Candidatus Nanoarchaeia archaeon]|nr:hypothetical protein [Candidatus Nanoarchaeia archaeon]
MSKKVKPMDITQIQKANQMAKDLVTRGIASTMEEGMQIAENILTKSEAVVPVASGPAGATPMKVSISTANVSSTAASVPISEELSTELRTLNFRLNEQANHIKHLQQQIMELNGKLATAHTVHAQPKVISEPAPSGQTQFVREESAQKMVTIINAATGEQVNVAETGGNTDSVGKRLHARVGAYTSGDVAVEKMFYCGGK